VIGALRRKHFLSFASVVALGVGSVALFAPDALLSTKGVVENAAATVWMREVGVMLVAIGFIAWCVRDHPDSPTMRAFLWGNTLLQLLLLPVEILAYGQGTITNLSGIVPNSILNLLLGLGFFVAARSTAPQYLRGRSV
jgi:hypothetical protein